MVDFHVGTFDVATSTGNQAVTGVGFQPKAIIFWMTGSAAASANTDAWVRHTVGFTSGPTESYSTAGGAIDNASSAETWRAMTDDAIAIVHAQSGLEARADLSSFDSDGFTLNWTSTTTDARKVHYLAIGGSGLSAKAVNWNAPDSTGNHGVTGVGFEPDIVFHMTSQNREFDATLPASTSDMAMNFGVMDASGAQWTNSVSSEDAIGTSNTSRYQRTDKCVGQLGIAGSLEFQASFVSMDSDGFTVNFDTVQGETINMASLCLSGLDVAVGSFDQTSNTTTPVTQSISGLGISPDALLMSTIGFTASTIVNDNAGWAFGASDGTTDVAAAQHDRDNEATTVAKSRWFDGRVIIHPYFSTATVRGELQSFDAGGFTLNWTDNTTSTQEEFTYVALAAPNTPPNAPTINSPSDGVVVDLTEGVTFDWTHNDPDSDAQTGYALKRRQWNGQLEIQSEEWWDGSTWTSSETTVTTSNTSVTISTWPAADTTYEYAIATSDGILGSYSSWRSLNPFEWWDGSQWVTMTETFVTSSADLATVSDFGQDGSFKWTVATKDADGLDGDYATEYQYFIVTFERWGAVHI